MTTPSHPPLNPQAWLALQPLEENQRLYLIISAASDADALTALRLAEPALALSPLWNDTPYAAWQSVMPYVAELQPGSAFLPWVAETCALDWGWLAVSRSDPDTVAKHLRSLTQVKMPDGTAVFFRFWDGRHILPVLETPGGTAAEVLPIFERYLINGKALEFAPGKTSMAKQSPWWEVPKALLETLTRQNPSTQAAQLMQWLEEERLDLYTAWPEKNLELKITRFLRRSHGKENLHEALLNQLREQG